MADAWEINQCDNQGGFIINMATAASYAWSSSVVTIILLIMTIVFYFIAKEFNRNVMILMMLVIICSLGALFNQQQVGINNDNLVKCEKLSKVQEKKI